MVVAIEQRLDGEVIAEAISARKMAERVEGEASPSRWREADAYAELSRRGWSTRRIGEKCGVSHTTVRIHVTAVERYLSKERPPFWQAYAEVTGEKGHASRNAGDSASDEWYTPAKYIEAARQVLGEIDLDPASSDKANKTVRAKKFFTSADDGLSRKWAGRVWLNPPWGEVGPEFVNRLVSEFEKGNVQAAILLVNAHSTDSEWFQLLWGYPLCFTDHRIDFVQDKEKQSSSTHGSVFVYLGSQQARFAQVFTQFGAVVRRWPE